MRRIEVVATIRDAYVFAVTHLGGVIGLIWVPMVLATIMGFFSLQRYYNDFIDAMAGGNVAALGPSMSGSETISMSGVPARLRSMPDCFGRPSCRFPGAGGCPGWADRPPP